MGAAAIPTAVGLQVFGGVYGAMAADQEGRAKEGYYNYLARQADTNAKLAEAAGAAQSHSIQSAAAKEYARLQTSVAQAKGAQKAALAGQGIADSVTAQDIAKDTEDKALLDEMAIRYNADTQSDEVLRQAGLTAFNARHEAEGYRMSAKEARRAGRTNAYASIVSSATSVANTLALVNKGPKAPKEPLPTAYGYTGARTSQRGFPR